MKMPSANIMDSRKKSAWREQASFRIMLLALVSFLLGVAASAVWLQFAPRHNVEAGAFQTTGQLAAGQPAAPTGSAQSPALRPAVNQPPVNDAAIIAEVKRAIPNFASVSEDDGEKILRAAALKEFTVAAKEMGAQIQAAQQQLVQSEGSQSAVQQQAVIKHLQQTQAAQAEKLQQIAARLQLQIAAWKKLNNPK